MRSFVRSVANVGVEATLAAKENPILRNRNMRSHTVKRRQWQVVCVRFLVLALVFIAALNDRAPAEPAPLTGKMAWWQQIVGSWTCEVRIRPTEGQPAQTLVTIAKGSIAPGNVFHITEVAPELETDQYNGYSDSQKIWWESQANSFGYATLLLSSDNKVFVQISSPPPFEADRNRYREAYKLGADGRFYQATERQVDGVWEPYDESSCKRMQQLGH